METNENETKVKQDEQEEPKSNESSSPQNEDSNKSDPALPEEPKDVNPAANEPDSTVTDNPVNLKMDNEEQVAPSSSQAEEIKNSPPPLHHVRTITLTSDYRHQEQENLESAQQLTNQEMVNENPTTLYVEEAAVDGQQDGNYYQSHHYTDENGTTVRYREIITHKNGVQQLELIDAAAVAAGVPTGHYIMMEGEEDDQDDRASAFLGSRLATFQVYSNMIFLICLKINWVCIIDLWI